jgi:hypothetical protein
MSRALQHHQKAAGETRAVAVDYRGLLDDDELLSGSPSASGSPSGLTISSVAKNTTAITVDGSSVPVSQAVQFLVAGGTAGLTYTITVTCNSDGGQVALEAILTLTVT